MTRKGTGFPLATSTKAGLVILDAIMVVLSGWIGWEADRDMPTTITTQNMGETVGTQFGINLARFLAPFVWIIAAVCIVTTVILFALDKRSRG